MTAVRRPLACGVAVIIGVLSTPVLAHEPILKCVLLDPATVRCRGGYAEGETAQGERLEVIDHADRRLLAGKLGKDGTLTFARPKGPYYVLFDVGPGHQAIVEHDEISLPRASDRARWVRK
ncbi:hypothetical protein DAH51_18530 [Sphingobium yanoikuyae]|uniref:Uncharacterized protein n=1 Tax=Sphingobium yanoikuyae TaxID=13690 RepID=A0A430BQI7_SPHYA|nr:hypothetical protein DAH51_18530 [Sphingobium yanoikuyae]